MSSAASLYKYSNVRSHFLISTEIFTMYSMKIIHYVTNFEELDGPVVSELRRLIAEVKQRWWVIGWVTKNLLFWAPPCFGTHVKPLVPAVFVATSTHQLALGPRVGLWPVLIMCWITHKEDLCPISRDINRLMMMMMKQVLNHQKIQLFPSTNNTINIRSESQKPMN
jgi:hypothetical protein